MFRRAPRGLLGWQNLQDEASTTRWSRSNLRIWAPLCVWWEEQVILTQRRARAPITPLADYFRTLLRIFRILPAS